LVLYPSGVRKCIFCKAPRPVVGPTELSALCVHGIIPSGVKQMDTAHTTKLFLVSWLRISVAKPPLLHMPSWHAQVLCLITFQGDFVFRMLKNTGPNKAMWRVFFFGGGVEVGPVQAHLGRLYSFLLFLRMRSYKCSKICIYLYISNIPKWFCEDFGAVSVGYT
jgi:hypothetical protein